MSTGFSNSSSIILINMGGEMFYILEQRLRAQSVDPQKGIKVLTDIIKMLFSKNFVDQLFEPQVTFSMKFTQQLFDKMVHCSIMQLNEASFNKLFDLMLMGLKQQILNCTSPHQMYYVTMNHLNSIKAIIKNTPEVALVEYAINKFNEKMRGLEVMDFILIRRELMQFLQDKQVRVYIFLQDKIQNADGTFVIDISPPFAPPYFKKPGEIVIFDQNGEVLQKTEATLQTSKGFRENQCTGFLDFNYSSLGMNMYAVDRDAKRMEEKNNNNTPSGNMETPTPGQDFSVIKKSTNQQFQSDQEMIEELQLDSGSAQREMDMLANFILGGSKNTGKEEEYKLNLFQQNLSFTSGGGSNDDIGEDFFSDMIIIDVKESGQEKIKQNIKNLFGDEEDDQTKNQKQGGDGDDLLDLMDSLADS